jgi:phosphatidylserine/phosphatidylglycerophosphate/cardiolipin synthase-like enzyme
MDEIFTAIGKAKHGALFLLFNAGTPSIVEQINEKCREYKDKGKYFFVRGAISDSRTSEKFRTRVYNDSMLENPNTLITGVGGVPGDYAFWEKELAQMGHAVIHDKILVLDPFSEKCTVITGSHNLGFKASFSNTENLCIIRDNKAVAAAYTAHIMDVVNHFNWRNKVSEAEKAKKAGKEVKVIYPHLDMDDRWQDKYFRGDFQKSRDRFFFGSA